MTTYDFSHGLDRSRRLSRRRKGPRGAAWAGRTVDTPVAETIAPSKAIATDDLAIEGSCQPTEAPWFSRKGIRKAVGIHGDPESDYLEAVRARGELSISDLVIMFVVAVVVAGVLVHHYVLDSAQAGQAVAKPAIIAVPAAPVRCDDDSHFDRNC